MLTGLKFCCCIWNILVFSSRRYRQPICEEFGALSHKGSKQPGYAVINCTAMCCVGCPLCVQAAVKWEVTANFCESVIYLFILSGLIGLSLLIKNSDYVSGRTQALQWLHHYPWPHYSWNWHGHKCTRAQENRQCNFTFIFFNYTCLLTCRLLTVTKLLQTWCDECASAGPYWCMKCTVALLLLLYVQAMKTNSLKFPLWIVWIQRSV